MESLLVVGAGLVNVTFVQQIKRALPRSFTFGELLLVGQAFSLLTVDALLQLIQVVGIKLNPDSSDPQLKLSQAFPSALPNLMFYRSPQHIFLHSLVLGMLGIGFALYPLLQRIRITKHLKADHMRLSMYFYVASFMIVFLVIRPWTLLMLRREPFFWYLSKDFGIEFR
jgi:hypothetical protein